MTQKYRYTYAGELRTVRCCDCGGYVGSHYASAIANYRKQCLKTSKFVWAMQKPCDRFHDFNEKFILVKCPNCGNAVSQEELDDYRGVCGLCDELQRDTRMSMP